MKEYNWRENRPAKPRGASASYRPHIEQAERKLVDEANEHFRIYFPSEETVTQSKGGRGVSSTPGELSNTNFLPLFGSADADLLFS
jgi:hypothetical protein